MQRGKSRNMFPGGNTSRGFFSYFDHIIRRDRAKRIFILKGGPGVGKSTLMKGISEAMIKKGHDVELMHCSSDPGSLDAVVIPDAGVALLDGTAPHVVDPKTPGALDEIINFGEFWDADGILENKNRIIETGNEIRSFFMRAYRYLGAASHIYEDNAAMYAKAMDRARPSFAIAEFADILFESLPPSDIPGNERCLFASAITPVGLVNYLDDLMTADNIYMLKGFPGAETERVLETIKSAAVERGFNVEAFYCAFDPGKLEHLILPDINTAFTTVNDYHTTDACVIGKVDFGQMLDDKIIGKYKSEIEYNSNEFSRLLDKAVEMIHNAKKLHDELETYYIPFMDFSSVKKKREELIERILAYV